MRLLKTAAALATAGLLAACATAENVDTLQNTQATGSAFTRSLATEYTDLATYERQEMYDWRDADYFAAKGLRAADGEVVAPQPLDARDLPADKMDELSQARGDLVSVLDKGARGGHPKLAARAQGAFDCWMEQQEENHQEEHIAKCRERFYKAMSQLKEAMKPKAEAEPEPEPAPEPEPEMVEPERLTVYFPFDSAALQSAATGKIEQAVRIAREMEDVRFSVTGHADTAGPADYNQQLSLRRAEAVRNALAERGIARTDISIAARGESQPAEATGDGVRAQANRRVVIVVQ